MVHILWLLLHGQTAFHRTREVDESGAERFTAFLPLLLPPADPPKPVELGLSM